LPFLAGPAESAVIKGQYRYRWESVDLKFHGPDGTCHFERMSRELRMALRATKGDENGGRVA
jgi:hypothetical protein